MSSCGIYTFGNDYVYDQLIALLNSIEANVGTDFPVCIIPYDQRLDKILPEIRARKQVTLYDDWESIKEWDHFVKEVWASHPRSKDVNGNREFWFYQGNTHRKLVSFNGLFEKFVFYDTDSLAMKPLNNLFEKLDHYDFVFDDWEHIKAEKIAALNIPLIENTGIYKEKDIRPKLHCSSFFGSKKGLFNKSDLVNFKKQLIDNREVEWINGKAWWDEAALFTYMTLRAERSFFNYTLSSDGSERTGNCANADPFVNIDNVLYNQEKLKPIHRIHYMGYSSVDFGRLSQGEDVHIPYQDVFLHYRFLKQPELKPQKLKFPSFWVKMKRNLGNITQKIKKKFATIGG
ncbi:Methionine synthase [Planktothrix agardhii]|uniref:Methionine synthase n=2 Tax=Microcoleaceae TaxID=1892252 RepID=A0A1U9WXM9_PLAAG|nr:methionine synthase [Planktothrix agardhii No758]CAD0229211.1 Methionine synthase [Planktothrix agardhii]CAD5973009.1 Methionine synthase [Planktothrix agardhii]CAH2573993.1 Methionine synthase [Planktothrix rubescens]